MESKYFVELNSYVSEKISGGQNNLGQDNWGRTTSGAIDDGFPQGEHSADPSGDGLSREDRMGLGNLNEVLGGKSGLGSLNDFVSSML